MKILLCAYACEPNRGSEPGIGWKWGYNLALYTTHEVYVLTRLNNQNKIEAYRQYNKTPSNLHFLYYDLPSPIVFLKHHGLPINIYYALWLYGAGNLAYKLHKKHHFDVAHHLTFGVFRDPSFLYRLKIPYMIGPVGGGETTPQKLYSIFTLTPLFKEALRIITNRLSFYNPYLIKSYNKASIILCKTLETKSILKKWSYKSYLQLELGINEELLNNNNLMHERKDIFLFVGRFVQWKGIELVLSSFANYVHKFNNKSILLFIGKGKGIKYIESFINKNRISQNVEIIPWIEQNKLKEYYLTSKALLFPSLHDSSGNVVLEALSHGLPVISLDCGGPSAILGQKLKSMTVNSNKSKEEIINEITFKMHQLTSDNFFFQTIQKLSIERAKDFSWNKVINHTYDLFFSSLKK